jgi:hypothetical protein
MATLAALAALAPTAAARPERPPAGARFSYQIGGAFKPRAAARIVDRDRRAAPVPGRYNVCYVNAFQAQPDDLAGWRAHHPRLLLRRRGREVVDRAWNEVLLDTSTEAKRRALLHVVGRWLDGCARRGFQAVEPDNLDSWTRSKGLLSRRDNLAMAALLIRHAHARGLAIAQKNAAEASGAGRRLGFDFAIAEECQPYRECGRYERAYGREVIEIEYPDDGGQANFAVACRARGARVSVVYRDRDVRPAGRRGFVERWCAQPPGRTSSAGRLPSTSGASAAGFTGVGRGAT